MIIDRECGKTIETTDWNKYDHDWTTVESISKPLMDGYLDFSPWRSMHDTKNVTHTSNRLSRDCLTEAMIHYWQHDASTEEIDAACKDPRNAFLFGHLTWMVVLEYISSIISELETRLWLFEELPKLPSSNELKEELYRQQKTLANVNRWRRRTWWLTEDLQKNLDTLMGRKTGYDQSSPDAGIFIGTMEDFDSILKRLILCRERIESFLPTVLGTFSLLEAQKSTVEARYGLWIAILATFFIPLTFVSGLFSMSDDYLPNGPSFWIYWVVSVSLIIFVLILSAITLAIKYRRVLASSATIQRITNGTLGWRTQLTQPSKST
jgi:hypothetical protein